MIGLTWSVNVIIDEILAILLVLPIIIDEL